MAKFEASSPDVILELKTLAGEEINLTPSMIMSGTNIVKLVKQWSALEEPVKEGEEKRSPVEVCAAELALLYPKPAKWFLDNLDVGTLQAILVHVATAVAEVKKNILTSK